MDTNKNMYLSEKHTCQKSHVTYLKTLNVFEDVCLTVMLIILKSLLSKPWPVSPINLRVKAINIVKY